MPGKLWVKSQYVYPPEEVERLRRFKDITPNGVVFDWSLVNIDGASFTLIRESHHTDSDMDLAASQILADRDVVGKIKVATIQVPTDS